MPCEILATDTPERFDAAVERAVAALRAGEVVALPTETVYGLAANAWNADAVRRIFEIKGRPAHNPVIVHVDSPELARDCVSSWPETAEKFARAFWPGPLTLVLPRGERIPDVVTAGGETVAVRLPSHPFIRAVIREAGFPLAAPSANRSNEISPTTAEHVVASLGDRLPFVVDGGLSQVGIESTVLDLSVHPPRVLRPGMIHQNALRAVLGKLDDVGPETSGKLKSPGGLPRHYAPKATLIVLRWEDEADLLDQARRRGIDPGRTIVIAHRRPPAPGIWMEVHLIPHDADAYGRALYDELHRCDAAQADWIIVEAVPPTPEWRAIADRLHRASHAGSEAAE